MDKVQFTTDGLIKYFEQLLEEAKNIATANCADDIECWWLKATSCCKRMGKYYEDMLGEIKFHPGVCVIGTYKDQDRITRFNGLQKAQKRIKVVIDNLNTFGFMPQNETNISKEETTTPNITNNLNISQNVSLSIKNYPPEIRPLIISIKDELQKDKIDKSIVGQLLSQLADAGIDILKEIILRGIGV